ncbi:MAG: methylmalonyl Co-A mutase-associated GTPase MeaB [Deltaproteobacteria bacterium]|nr:methylmalonyl Co-A mutase-associated GTPase MeaB [Deltaproteobacteria bacterium]
MQLEDYVDGVRRGDRRVLAKAITLVESRRADHQALAQELVERLLDASGSAIRIGITGVPGVGKSTLIGALGAQLIEAGERVAVLAIDPTSQRSGGSIMGDKTRMERLAGDERAFIRPSPTGGTLGGVARRTREAMLLCEAAGHGVVLIETVGVGQSEAAVADLVDFFALLILPGAGDGLQGIKRGVVELADAVVVNKADQAPTAAERAALDYGAALELLTPLDGGWRPRVLLTSAATGSGLRELWQTVLEHRRALGAAGLAARRRRQALTWLHRLIDDELRQRLLASPALRRELAALEAQVLSGRATPTRAARSLVEAFVLKK